MSDVWPVPGGLVCFPCISRRCSHDLPEPKPGKVGGHIIPAITIVMGAAACADCMLIELRYLPPASFPFPIYPKLELL